MGDGDEGRALGKRRTKTVPPEIKTVIRDAHLSAFQARYILDVQREDAKEEAGNAVATCGPTAVENSLTALYARATNVLEELRIRRDPSSLLVLREIADVLDRLHAQYQPPKDADLDPDFRPASAFPKHIRARIRQAATAKTKHKRVRKKLIGGIVHYSFADAMRHWPEDMVEMRVRVRNE